MPNYLNKHILVTRPNPQGTELCFRIKELGGKAIHLPTLAFAPSPDPTTFQQAIEKLGEHEWIIFISPQSVYASLGAMRNRWPVFPNQVRLAAVGAGTAKALKQFGYFVHVLPLKEWNSDGLLALPEFQNVRHTKIAIVRGAGGREKVDQILAERGAEILPVIAYERILPKLDVLPYQRLFEENGIDVIICTSFEGVRNLKMLLGERTWIHLKSIPLLVVSKRIKMLAEDLGFQTIWVTPNASNDAILATLNTMRDSND